MAVSLLLVACSDKPDGMIPESDLVDLMADMQLAEAYNDVSNGYRTIGENRRKSGAAVLKAHGITPEQLDSTLSWYGRNIDDYQALYDKVDKELNARRKKLLGGGNDTGNLDDIWPYSPYLVFSPLSGTSSFSFSLPTPALAKGESVVWKMYTGAQQAPKLMLGVDYEDGTTDLITRAMNVDRGVSVKIQTDTAKTVRRLYGVVRVPSRSMLPFRLDSIALLKNPYDSTTYVALRSQYHLPRVRPEAVKVESKSDSVASGRYRSKADSIRELPVLPPAQAAKLKRKEL